MIILNCKKFENKIAKYIQKNKMNGEKKRKEQICLLTDLYKIFI